MVFAAMCEECARVASSRLVIAVDGLDLLDDRLRPLLDWLPTNNAKVNR